MSAQVIPMPVEPILPEWLAVVMQQPEPTVPFTIFLDVTAQSKQEQSMLWQQLAVTVASPPTYPSKHACPLIKLATLGDSRTDKGSLRHDGNVLAVSGIELDYDDEQVSLATAADALRRANVAAVLYTSASHTPDKPRWRILCALSAPVAPAEREGLVARLDNLLDNIAAPESYTLSQTFFFGRVEGAPFESVVIEGQPLDLAGLPPGHRVIKPTKGKEPTRTLPIPDNIDDVLSRIDPLGEYSTVWSPTVLGTLNSFGAAAVPNLVAWSMPWYEANEWTEAKATADIAGRIQQTGTATWENVRERAGLPREDLSGLFGPPEQQQEEWPDTQPVPDVVLPAPAFDYTMLPAPFVDWVTDISTRKSWAPDYAAVALMTLCGSLLGRKVALLPDDTDPTWRLFPNLWGLLIGMPSSAKTPSIGEAMRLLKPVEANAEAWFEMVSKSYTRELAFHRAKVKSMEAKRTTALGKDDEATAREIHNQISDTEDAFNLRRPKRRRFFTTDATYERLFSLMVDNPQGLMLYKDEMANLMAQMTMENFAMLRSFLLSAWDGATPVTKDRIKDEEAPLPTIAACISALGGLQPSLLPRFLGGSRDGSEGDDGFPQRFGLLVWPDDPPLVPNETPKDMEAEQTAAAVIRQLEGWPLNDAPIAYSFDGPTQRAFRLWHSKLVSDNRSGVTDPALVTWLGKYPKTIASLALITALIEGRTVVDAPAWGKAMKWENYLRGHLNRIMDYSTRRATQHANNIIRKIRESVPGGDNSILNVHGGMVYLTSRTLTNRQFPGCGVTKETDDLLEWLEELGYVRFRGPGTVKGVKKLWEINPKLVRK